MAGSQQEADLQRRQEAFEQAQIDEAAGDDERVVEVLAPWANRLEGQGIVGLQTLRIASLKRTGRQQEAEEALNAFGEVHPFYPMSQMVDGAIAWKSSDWWGVVLAYADAMVQVKELETLWPRVKHGLRMVKQQHMEPEPETLQQLKQHMTQAAEPPITDTAIEMLLEAVALLPVDPQHAVQRRTALERAEGLLPGGTRKGYS